MSVEGVVYKISVVNPFSTSLFLSRQIRHLANICLVLAVSARARRMEHHDLNSPEQNSGGSERDRAAAMAVRMP